MKTVERAGCMSKGPGVGKARATEEIAERPAGQGQWARGRAQAAGLEAEVRERSGPSQETAGGTCGSDLFLEEPSGMLAPAHTGREVGSEHHFPTPLSGRRTAA